MHQWMFIHIFFLTVKVSRGTDYEEGYIKVDQQTQTVTTCGCYEKAPVYGRAWDDSVRYDKSLIYKKNEVMERAKTVELGNRIHIPTGEDRDRLR